MRKETGTIEAPPVGIGAFGSATPLVIPPIEPEPAPSPPDPTPPTRRDVTYQAAGGPGSAVVTVATGPGNAPPATSRSDPSG
jgi:hypothetical protein